MAKLIFDRTNNDVSRLKTLRTKVRNRTASEKEYQEWLTSLKGAYNNTDLNRVGDAINYLSDVLNYYGYSNNAQARTDWSKSEKPNPEQMNEYLTNLNKLKEAYFVKNTTPELPTDMVKLTFAEANNIEKMLQDITDLLAYATEGFIYLGVANLGQNRLWQQRFRKSKVWATQNYMFSQYLDNDTVLTISSKDEGIIENGTTKLNIAQFNQHQKVCNSIATMNNSMNKIDELVGYPVEFYNIRNIIPDNSFENNKWEGANYSTSEKCFGNRSLYFPVGTTFVANIQIERPIVGHTYYGRRYIKTNGNNEPADCRFEVWGADGENKNWVYAWNKGDFPNWEFGSDIHTIAGVDYPETDRTIIRCFNVATTADTWVDGLMLIDLTECFGLGNEPDKDWCDANIPYIEQKAVIAVDKIPKKYEFLNYIESSKTQWIDTNYFVKYGDVVTIDMAFIDTQSYFGYYKANTDRFGLGVAKGAYEMVNGSNSSIWKPTSDTERHTFVIDTTGQMKLDDTVQAVTAMAMDFVPTYSFALFGRKQSETSTSYRGQHRLYGFKVENGGNTIMNLVPCKRNEDNVIGLLDTVSGNFLINSGTGTFIGA